MLIPSCSVCPSYSFVRSDELFSGIHYSAGQILKTFVVNNRSTTRTLDRASSTLTQTLLLFLLEYVRYVRRVCRALSARDRSGDSRRVRMLSSLIFLVFTPLC